MPYDPTKSTGIHALDITQHISTDQQYYWKSGCAVTTTSETATIETHVDAGTVVRDGLTIDVPATDLAHDDGDVNNPRWDTICVINDNGGLQIYKGTPEPVQTDSTGAELRGEPAYTPSPSDSVPNDVVPLAMVWIPEGASANSDLTDTSAGGVSEPIIDRRIGQSGQAEQVTRRTEITTSGWYRIAKNGSVADGASDGTRADGLFTIRDTQSGLQSALSFRAACIFGSNPTLTLNNTSNSGGTVGAFTKLRIVHGSTYEGAAVEAYVDLQGQTQVNSVYATTYQNRHLNGWSPVNWTAGSVPTGFSTTVLDLADNPMLGAARNGSHFKVDGSGRATAEEVFPRTLGTKVTRDANMIVSPNTETVMGFNVAIRNPRSAFSTSSNEYTVPFDGIYKTTLKLGWLSDADFSSPAQLRCFIHNSTTGTNLSQSFDVGYDDTVHVSTVLSDELDLTSGDNIVVKVLHKAAGDVSINSGMDWSHWTIRPIGGSTL